MNTFSESGLFSSSQGFEQTELAQPRHPFGHSAWQGQTLKHLMKNQDFKILTVDLYIEISLALVNAALVRTSLNTLGKDYLQVILKTWLKIDFSGIFGQL